MMSSLSEMKRGTASIIVITARMSSSTRPSMASGSLIYHSIFLLRERDLKDPPSNMATHTLSFFMYNYKYSQGSALKRQFLN